MQKWYFVCRFEYTIKLIIMIKQLLSIGLISASLMAGAQSFTGMYHFTGVTTGTANTGTVDPTPVPTATGLVFSSFTAVGTPTATSAAGVFAFSGWDLGATNGSDVYSSMTQTINPAKYYEVTLTPQGAYNVSLSSVSFYVNRSGTGPRTFAWKSNQDGFVANLPAVSTNTNISIQAGNVFLWDSDAFAPSAGNQQKGCSVALSGPDFANHVSPYTFRFYPYNAEATGGTFRIDTVIFNGEASIATKLGTVSFDINSNFNVYPVPSHDGVLFIENKNAAEFTKIEVLDVLGNVVATNNPKNETKVKLNLAEMPNGNYFVRMYSGSMISTKKIVIVK